jgi:putative phosphoribosyl transferase
MMAAMTMKLRHTEVGLPAGGRWLDGILAHHPQVRGLAILVERSGSTLKTARGAFIADALGAAGFATLQVALLSHDEERRSPEAWRQVSGLVPRLAAVVEWIRHQPALKELPLAIVARDAAAAAMVRVAARGSAPLRALVSRAGRPDLAGIEPLRDLSTPTLLLVGELDDETLPQNRQVHDLLTCPKELSIVRGASHGFEELGALDQASHLIADWLCRWIPERAS